MTAITFVKLLPSLFTWGKAKVVHHREVGVKANTFVIVLLAAAVAVGTVILFSLPFPEELRTRSTDGRAWVSGRGMPGSSVGIMRHDDVQGPFTAVLGPVYEVSLTRVAAGEPLELMISYDGLGLGGVAPSDLALVRYDRSFGAWRVHPAVPDSVTRRLMTTISTGEAGLWAVGRIPSSEVPSSLEVLVSELLASPPSGAIAYRAQATVSTADSDFVFVGDELVRGGCGGNYTTSPFTTRTSSERRIGKATYRVHVLWNLQEGGCESPTRLLPE